MSRAAGGKLWQEAKTLMADLVDTEPLAAFDMGVLWDRGFPDQDFRMAIKYYEIASRGGNAKAKFNIALMYKRGEGVIPSNEDSALYMEDAAMHGTCELFRSVVSDSLGHRQAMLSMAKFYTKGIGCKKDGSAALRFYKMAVEKWRDECASNKIASWYGKGKHVPKDFRTAIKYNTKKAITQKYWEPVWTEGALCCSQFLTVSVWPQMLLLQAVLVQEEESPLHELPRELIELFWSTLVDVYFYQKEQLMWEEPEEPDFDFF